MDTLERAKNDIRQGWETPSGAICPCCAQLVKLYQRQIYYAPAKALIELYHLNRVEPGFHHLRELNPDIGGSDFSKLKHWGLIEKEPINDDPKKRTSGMWKITPLGELFVEDRAKVHKYAHIFNDNLEMMSGPAVGIREVLGKDFDYSELMGYLL